MQKDNHWIDLLNKYPKEIYYYLLFAWKMTYYNYDMINDKISENNRLQLQKKVDNFLLSIISEQTTLSASNVKRAIENDDVQHYLKILDDATQNKMLNILIQNYAVHLEMLSSQYQMLPNKMIRDYQKGCCYGIVMSMIYSGVKDFYHNQNMEWVFNRWLSKIYRYFHFEISTDALYQFNMDYLTNNLFTRCNLEQATLKDMVFYETHHFTYRDDHKMYAVQFSQQHPAVAEWIECYYDLEEIYLLQYLDRQYRDKQKFKQVNTFYYKNDKHQKLKNYSYKHALSYMDCHRYPTLPFIHTDFLDPCLNIMYKHSVLSQKTKDISVCLPIELVSFVEQLEAFSNDLFILRYIPYRSNDSDKSAMISNHVSVIMKYCHYYYCIDNLTYRFFLHSRELVQWILHQYLHYYQSELSKISHCVFQIKAIADMSDPDQQQVFQSKNIMKILNEKKYFYARELIMDYGVSELMNKKEIIVEYRRLLYQFSEKTSDDDIFYLLFDIEKSYFMTEFGQGVLNILLSNQELIVYLKRQYEQKKLSFFNSLNDCIDKALQIRQIMYVYETETDHITCTTRLGELIRLHTHLSIYP